MAHSPKSITYLYDNALEDQVITMDLTRPDGETGISIPSDWQELGTATLAISGGVMPESRLGADLRTRLYRLRLRLGMAILP